jgi:hypothetical protein
MQCSQCWQERAPSLAGAAAIMLHWAHPLGHMSPWPFMGQHTAAAGVAANQPHLLSCTVSGVLLLAPAWVVIRLGQDVRGRRGGRTAGCTPPTRGFGQGEAWALLANRLLVL